jgi:hypothetical protein
MGAFRRCVAPGVVSSVRSAPCRPYACRSVALADASSQALRIGFEATPTPRTLRAIVTCPLSGVPAGISIMAVGLILRRGTSLVSGAWLAESCLSAVPAAQ